MPRPQDDDVAWGSAATGPLPPYPGRAGSPGLVTPRTLILAGGFALAVAATLAVFVTENPKHLQLAVIVMAWAFVLAAFAAGRRGSDRATATARETQLRQAYELELEREVAARREYELDLEHDLRREAEDAMRDELDALRGEIASLGRLREEVARVSDLRHDLADLSALREDLADLSALREDVARVAALRDDLVGLGSLRQDLGQLAELRADMGRLRAELTEQLSSEMLIERIVMRTQGVRLPADQGLPDSVDRPLDVSASWSDDTPPRELTGGWPAVRLDDPRDAGHAEQVRADRSVPSRHNPSPPLWSTAPATTTFNGDAPPPPASTGVRGPAFERPAPPSAPPVAVPPAPSAEPRSWEEPRPWEEPRSWDEPRRPWDEPRSWDEPRRPWDEHRSWEQPRPWERDAAPAQPSPSWLPGPVDAHRSGHSPAEPPAVPPSPSTGLQPTPALRPAPRPRPTPPPPSARLRPDLPPLTGRVDEAETGPITADRPAAGPPPGSHADRARDGAPAPAGGPESDSRLAELLAENGVDPASGGRRRRRYREDGEPDDVLARVLGLG